MRFLAISSRPLLPLAVGALIIALTASILLTMGRVPICTCGEIKFWVGEVNSPDNSQHLADWYSLSHIIHGFLFYWALAAAAPRLAVGWRATIAILVEAAWEIVENSPLIINRYREATMAVGYAGDSVINSVADIVWMLVGFWLARALPVWMTIALAIAFEVVAAIVIRDNLTLNVVMLIWPIDAIRAWQSAL
ncbi:DUF2585 domain-containing protein [Mesorhizobium xinjiangense]|uniref:DUF2585 domain-containing protein n=1 Tax=Mesorhizobium xinjiangense TaxID=2678685 RepID=UPI0012ED6662|nr:DUF2585 domain-containing protein [Mesorhizobium xinjiangense]